jgi:hypothetical protein
MSLRKLYKKMEKYRTGKHYDRRPYFYMDAIHNGVAHRFEIRRWKMVNYTIYISAVNWTITAGPCSIKLSGKNYRKFKISEN